MPSGHGQRNGWLLTLADALWSEYGWSEEYVLDELPLVRAIAYYRAIQARYDVDGRHPGFEDDERAGAGLADFRRQIRAALAAFKRSGKTLRKGRNKPAK